MKRNRGAALNPPLIKYSDSIIQEKLCLNWWRHNVEVYRERQPSNRPSRGGWFGIMQRCLRVLCRRRISAIHWRAVKLARPICQVTKPTTASAYCRTRKTPQTSGRELILNKWDLGRLPLALDFYQISTIQFKTSFNRIICKLFIHSTSFTC